MTGATARVRNVAPLEQVAAAPAKQRMSLLQYSPALVLLIVAITDSQRYADPDLWGHVRFGQEVLRAGRLITRDPYSYSAPGHLWLNHEWLAEIFMAWLYNQFGTIGLKLMKLGCSAGVVLFLVEGMTEAGSAPIIQFVVLTCAAVTLALQVQFRPQLFTFVLLSALLASFARFNYRGHARLWLAIPMLALWANLHGGFIMGLASLGIFGVTVMIQDVLAGHSAVRGIKILAITAAATIATLATPYGIGAWQVVLHALTNPYTRTVIIDWQTLTSALLGRVSDYHATYFYILIGLGLFSALFITYGLTPGGDLPLLAIAAVIIAAAFASIRNLPLAVIATVIPLSRHLDLTVQAWRKRQGLPTSLPRAPWNRIHQWVVAGAALVLMMGNGLLSNTLVGLGPYPVGAIAFMQEHHLRGNIVANFGWGQYVIWHLSPPSKLYIDGRYDTVYPQDVIDQYLAFHFGLPGANKFLSQDSHDFVLMGPDSKALRFATVATGWKELYRDGSCVLLGRSGPEINKIDAVTISPADTPKSYFP
jgi:hypothetical protein